jgi:hypothetical protein
LTSPKGAKDYVHSKAFGNNQFLKLDWQADPLNRFTLSASNNFSQYQIPNYPSTFKPTDPIFTTYGFNWAPPDTDDHQSEFNDFVQVVWKKDPVSTNLFSAGALLEIFPSEISK